MSVRASKQCIQKARKALVQKGWKQTELPQKAKLQGLSLTSQPVSSFFTGKNVAHHTEKTIGLLLELTWDDGDLEPVIREGESDTSSDSDIDIDELVQEVRSRCCDKIQHLYSKIRLLNRQQIDIDKLYVDVYVLEKLASEYQATIPTLLKDYDPQQDRLGLGQRGKRSPGFEVATRCEKVMVLGKPGSGKSTFSQHLAVACCKGEFLANYIPILIELRDIDASKFNLLNHIHQEFDLADEEQTKQILKQGKVLILLDGLDEVPGQSKREVQDHIYKFSQSQQYYKNRFILTCRTQTTEYTLQKFEYVEVADFNPEQVKIFAEKWFTALAETPEQGTELTVKFLDKLRLPENKQTAELAVTPILLSLTCWIFNDLKDLPPKRSDLYEQGINLLLKKWDEKRGVTRQVGNKIYRELSVKEKKQLLSYLAARKFEQEQYVLFERREIEKYIAEYLNISTEDAEAVLEAIEAQHGLLVERAKDIYSFSHLTFQEYFTALAVISSIESQDLEKSFSSITKKSWREVFLLAAGMMQPADGLMLLMKQRIDGLIANDEKLRQFLVWVSDKSPSVNLPYKAAAVRAFYLTLDLTLNGVLDPRFFLDSYHILNNFGFVRALDCTFDSTPFQTFDSTPFYSYFLIDDFLSIRYPVSLDPIPDFLLVRDLCRVLDPSLIHNNVRDISLSSADLRALDPELKQSLQQLQAQLPNPCEPNISKQWWETNSKTWANQLRETMIQYCNIGHDRQFSEPQKELLKEYFDANKLLIDCLNTGCVVREEIEETLLLPTNGAEQH